MRRLVKGALIALVIAGLVLAITGLVWWIPATPERGGHYCLGSLVSCYNV
jgi:hypothetical protein